MEWPSMTGSQIANRGVRREEIALRECGWLDIKLGVPAQDKAGPLGSTGAWDAWQAGESVH